jgi:prepilin-type N-terminal cleavage/methylation domain-containing protein
MERAEKNPTEGLPGDPPAKDKPRKAHAQRGGFTMVELLVVVGLLVLLASIFVINANSARMRAREALASSHGGAVAQTIRSYLTVWITDSPTALLARIADLLPRADWTGAPPEVRDDARPLDRSCTNAFTLIDPNGVATSYSWPSAPRGVGCVLGLRTQGGIVRLRAITWSNGSRKYYVDGLSP